MIQSAIILDLLERLAAEPDAAARAVLMAQAERQYHLDMEVQSSFVQSRIGNLELDIREQVATALGVTNDMISQVLADVRDDRTVRDACITQNTTAVDRLREQTEAGFRGVSERIGAIGEAVSGVEADVKALDGRVDALERKAEAGDGRR